MLWLATRFIWCCSNSRGDNESATVRSDTVSGTLGRKRPFAPGRTEESPHVQPRIPERMEIRPALAGVSPYTLGRDRAGRRFPTTGRRFGRQEPRQHAPPSTPARDGEMDASVRTCESVAPGDCDTIHTASRTPVCGHVRRLDAQPTARTDAGHPHLTHNLGSGNDAAQQPRPPCRERSL